MNLQEVLERLHDRGATDAILNNDKIIYPKGGRMHVFDRWKFQNDLLELVDDTDYREIKYSYILYEKTEY
jgi:hypothetical protein